MLGSCNTQPCLRGVYRHCVHENLRVIRVMGYPRLPANLLRVNEAAQPWDVQWPPLDVLWGPLCCCTKGELLKGTDSTFSLDALPLVLA